jgi:phosphoglycolate phosphatase
MQKKNLTISGVIFDLDGTLLDSLADIAAACNAALKKQGFSGHPVDAYRTFVGDGPRVLARRVLPEGERTAQNVEACLKDYLESYRNNSQPAARPYPGIVELLDALQHRSIPTAVVSNKEQAAADQSVRYLLGAWRFSPVLGFREGVPRKPDPAMALDAAGQFGMPPQRIAFVGDTAVDMQTAVAAEMIPVGALWGFRTREELEKSGAEILLENPERLLNHI